MSDITERLRALVTTQDHDRGCDGRMYTCTCGHDARIDATVAEAADEIERLRAALGAVAPLLDYLPHPHCVTAIDAARAALGDQP